jgi:Protein of unknown function (DUF3810)
VATRRAAASRRLQSTRVAAAPSTIRWWPRLLVIAAALFAAFATIPAGIVEARYARGFYPSIQPILTSVSSLFPIALFDAALLGAAWWTASRVVRAVRGTSGKRRRALAIVAADIGAAAAFVYLAFLICWGLNYRRLPITNGLDYSASRVTSQSVIRFADRGVTEMNRLHAAAHADESATLTMAAVRVRLAPAFAQAQRELGMTALASPARPKLSLLSPFFRWAAVDGMINPFGLEVLINPDVLPVERPFVIAHEWGHLAGWARESEASYVAWLTCLEGDVAARYSGWLSLYLHLRREVTNDERLALDRQLGAGPRADLLAIYARLERGRPAVQRMSWQAYDRFLKANRVAEGVRSYDDAVTLVLGIATDPAGRPRRIPTP